MFPSDEESATTLNPKNQNNNDDVLNGNDATTTITVSIGDRQKEE